jgi:hypothetical protein
MSPNSKGTGKLVLQVGQSIKIGALIDVHGTGNYSNPLDISGKFYTSNSKVASFDKNGILTARKSGKIKITCKCEGYKLRCNLTVLKKGSIKEANSLAIKEFTKNVNALDKIVNKGINAKNCYTIYNRWVALDTQWFEIFYSYLDKNINMDGGFLTKVKEGKNYSTTYTYTNKLVVPAYYTYENIGEKLNMYLYNEKTCFASGMGVEFKSTKITIKSAKETMKITVKLANKITKKEFFKMWVSSENGKKFGTSKEIITYIRLYRKTENGCYLTNNTVEATIKLSSNKIEMDVDGILSKGTYQFYDDTYQTKLITGTFKIK